MTPPSRLLAGLAAIIAAVIAVAATPTLHGVGHDGARHDEGRHDGSRATGRLAEGTTVFDGEAAGVSRLDGDLRAALRRAARDAADDGVQLEVTSGWRSPGYQRQLLAEAVSKYGSDTEAARWVATPETSPHVSGDAVDIGPYDAMDWLSRHGSAHGLCQIYANEPWHYELRPEAVDVGCPAAYDDPTQDPRMR